MRERARVVGSDGGAKWVARGGLPPSAIVTEGCGNDYRPPSPSFSPAGGNPVLFFAIRNWIPGQGPRMTAGEGSCRRSRWVFCGFAAIMTAEGNAHTTGLDSRAGPENDGLDARWSPLRHSHQQAGIQSCFCRCFSPVILAEGGNPECGLGLDSRGGHENDGGEVHWMMMGRCIG